MKIQTRKLNLRWVLSVVAVLALGFITWFVVRFNNQLLPLIFPPDDLIWEAPEYSLISIQLEDKGVTRANANLGDLDKDGDLDIVLAKGRHWPLVEFVLLNDGEGGFSNRHEVNADADRTYTAALADLDGDNDLDLVVGNDRPDTKRIYKNDGTGKFTLTGTFGDADWPTRNVTVVNLTGDNRPDIVVANRGGPNNLSANQICINDGTGNSFDCKQLSTESATTIAAGDFNNDGFVDLVVPHRDGGQSYIFLNDGEGGFSDKRAVGPSKSGSRAVAVADLNGDTFQDVVIGDPVKGGARVYLNNGSALFPSSFALGERMGHVYSIATADMDDDGDMDVIFGNRLAPGAILLKDDGENSYSAMKFGDGEGAVYGLSLGDVNSDGILDIVTARSDAPNMLYQGIRQ
ncbi:MAG: hypothetical protein GKR91_09475 [Pseudomonadales bacterium]|nr:hypothetical protein [Pseudomonadales bacterium]